MGYTLTYDGVPTTDLTGFICHEIERDLIAQPRTEFEYVGGLEGALVFAEEPGLRTIEADCSVLISAVSAPARRAAVREVAGWYNQRSMKKLILGDEPTMMEWAIPASAPRVTEWRQRGSFKLAWLCAPYSHDVNVTETAEVTASSDHIIQVNNAGNVRTPMIVEITAGGASATQAIEANGREWSRATALGAGTAVTFNTVAGVIHTGTVYDTELEGVFQNATLSMLTADGRPPYLEPGLNNVHVKLPSAGASVRILHRNRFA